MKIKILKPLILIFVLASFSCSLIKKENISFKLERQKLLSAEIEMQLPIPFHLQKENFEEGVIYFYSFIDSTNIIIVQGTMVEFPMDKYIVQKTEIRNQRKILVGFEKNRYWRKDIFEDVRIYYNNVTSKNKNLYNNILDGIKIKRLKDKRQPAL